MELEPRSLGIPLRRASRSWLNVLAGVLLVGFAFYFVSPPWGRAFMAAALLALPALLLAVASPGKGHVPSRLPRGAELLGVAALIVYLFAAKQYLLPLLLERLP